VNEADPSGAAPHWMSAASAQRIAIALATTGSLAAAVRQNPDLSVLTSQALLFTSQVAYSLAVGLDVCWTRVVYAPSRVTYTALPCGTNVSLSYGSVIANWLNIPNGAYVSTLIRRSSKRLAGYKTIRSDFIPFINFGFDFEGFQVQGSGGDCSRPSHTVLA